MENAGSKGIAISDIHVYFARSMPVLSGTRAPSKASSAPSVASDSSLQPTDRAGSRAKQFSRRSSVATLSTPIAIAPAGPPPAAAPTATPVDNSMYLGLGGSLREGMHRSVSMALSPASNAPVRPAAVSFAPAAQSPKAAVPAPVHPTHHRAKSAFPGTHKQDPPLFVPRSSTVLAEASDRPRLSVPNVLAPAQGSRLKRTATVEDVALVSPSPPSTIQSMIESATALPSAAIDQLKTHRRELTRMIASTVQTPFFDINTPLGEIPVPDADSSRDDFDMPDEDGDAAAFLDAVVARTSASIVARALPVELPPRARHGFAFRVHAPDDAASVMSIHAAPGDASSLTYSAAPRDGGVPTTAATAAALDLWVSLQWTSPHTMFPVTCRYRCGRALAYAPQCVVSLHVASARAGQPATLAVTVVHCAEDPLSLSLQFARPRRLGPSEQERGAAGLETEVGLLPLGLCAPFLPRRAAVPLRAFQAGLYDLTGIAVTANDAPVQAKVLGGLVCVLPE